MTRKLVAVATALLAATGLLVASAYAGPDGRAVGEGPLKVMARGALPFAAGPASEAASAKPMHGMAVTEQATAPGGKLAAHLAAQVADAATSDGTLAVVVVTSVDPETMKGKLSGIRMTHEYRQALYGFSANLTKDQLASLQALPEVESIGADEQVYTMLDGATRWTGAVKTREDFGVSGDGDGFADRYSTKDAVIAVIDTGINTGHKDLKGKVIGWKDFVSDKPDPYDDNGHGTHVSGIAAGAGVANPNLAGVAPGAALVGVKVLSDDGSGSFARVIAGVEWVVAHKEKFNIKVMNLSLGSSGSSDGADALSRAVNGAVEAGIVAVVAAGNSGPDNHTIGSPAAAARAITVCALRDPGENGWSPAPFSSRGPTADGRIKPDVCAPGIRITAPQAGTADRYVTFSGTSMASPFVAGVAALLLESNPYLTVADVQDAIFATAQDWGVPGKDNDYGFGRINVYRAVQRVLGLPGLGPANPIHSVGKGTITEGGEIWYRFEVTDLNRAVAATLFMTDRLERYYDLDLYLYDAAGNELAISQDIGRQETINLRVRKAGLYFLKVQAYEGSGPYSLDVSWR